MSEGERLRDRYVIAEQGRGWSVAVLAAVAGALAAAVLVTVVADLDPWWIAVAAVPALSIGWGAFEVWRDTAFVLTREGIEAPADVDSRFLDWEDVAELRLVTWEERQRAGARLVVSVARGLVACTAAGEVRITLRPLSPAFEQALVEQLAEARTLGLLPVPAPDEADGPAGGRHCEGVPSRRVARSRRSKRAAISRADG